MAVQVKGWERIYQEQGDLQFDVLPKVKRAARVFKEKGYKKVLDLGCGTGKHSLFLAGKGFEVYATDMAETGIKIAQEKAKLLGIENIRFKKHDMKEIPFADNFFDAVLCAWTIYHGTWQNIQKTIGEIYRVLKPDGTVLTDFLSVSDSTYGLGDEVEKNTFIGAKKQEEDVPHHYSTREELVQLFSEFRQLKIRAARARAYVDETGQKYIRKYYDVEAIK